MIKIVVIQRQRNHQAVIQISRLRMKVHHKVVHQVMNQVLLKRVIAMTHNQLRMPNTINQIAKRILLASKVTLKIHHQVTAIHNGHF